MTSTHLWSWIMLLFLTEGSTNAFQTTFQWTTPMLLGLQQELEQWVRQMGFFAVAALNFSVKYCRKICILFPTFSDIQIKFHQWLAQHFSHIKMKFNQWLIQHSKVYRKITWWYWERWLQLANNCGKGYTYTTKKKNYTCTWWRHLNLSFSVVRKKWLDL